MRYALLSILAIANFLASGKALAENVALEPFRLMRSLQLVQDRIAAGDHDAISLQDGLMPLIEDSFRAAGKGIGEDRRNLDALMIYALSGGDTDVIRDLLPNLKGHGREERIATAVLLQRSGEVGLAERALESTNVRDMPAPVGAYLAIFKAGFASDSDEANAISELDEARLAAPGTLVEEAALRRQLSLYSGHNDFAGVLRTARRYLQRFPFSPFGEPLVDTFAASAVRLARDEDQSPIMEIVDGLAPNLGRAVLRRLLRESAVQGRNSFLKWALDSYSARLGANTSKQEQANLAFFREVAAFPSLEAGEAIDRLSRIDANSLGPDEKRLLAGMVSVLAVGGSETRRDDKAMGSGKAKVDARHASPKIPERSTADLGGPKAERDIAGTAPKTAKDAPEGDAPGLASSAPEPSPAPAEGAAGAQTETGQGETAESEDLSAFIDGMRARLNALDQPAGGEK